MSASRVARHYGGCAGLHARPLPRQALLLPMPHATVVRPARQLAVVPAAAASSSSGPAPQQRQHQQVQHHHQQQARLLQRRAGRGPAPLPAASGSVVIDVDATSSSDIGDAPKGFRFACPICHTTHFDVPAQPASNAGLECARCARTFRASPDGAYLDLTLTSGAPPRVYNNKGWGGQELFRSPLISYVYERGWRQGFAWAGFPGADEEYDLAMSYLRQGRKAAPKPSGSGSGSDSGGSAGRAAAAWGDEGAGSLGTLVDMSCGSGLFTRRFARSGCFDGVVAADYSESMLRQTKAFLEERESSAIGSGGGSRSGSGRGGARRDSSTPGCPVLLLRADVGRLPFASGSVDAIHAGAAIHCWPNPQAAMAEIARVLAPGGVFVASTFLAAAAPLGELLGNDDLVRPLNQIDGSGRMASYKWWEEGELRDLASAVGLQDFQRERRWRFIMFSVRKPL